MSLELQPGAVLPKEMDSRHWDRWCKQGAFITVFTVATLPPTPTKPTMVYVSDALGGAILAFNDLSDSTWRRVDTRAVVT